MSLILTVPTHLDGRNPIVGRYTARELVPVVAGVFAAAGVLGQPHLLPPARIGEALAVAVLGALRGWCAPAAAHSWPGAGAPRRTCSASAPPPGHLRSRQPPLPRPVRPSVRRIWRSRR